MMKFERSVLKRGVCGASAVLAAGVLGWATMDATAADEADTVVLESGRPYIAAAGRSPIPLEGESFSTPLAFARLVDDTGEKIVADKPDGPVNWGAAHNYIGQRITVEGKIVDTYNHKGNVCFLNFDKQWQGKFYIPVFKGVFADLPEPPETYYLNKTIRVTGKVTQHQNRPNIEVQNVSQIEIVE